MPYRFFMTVQRGTMDKTAVCVFPWERPLLEEIHGQGAEVVTIDQLASLKDAAKVVPVELQDREYIDPVSRQTSIVSPDEAPNLRSQLEAMARVKRGSREDPFRDLSSEWARLMNMYGMHREVKMSVAEKVFGSEMAFRTIVIAYRGDTPPKLDPLYPDLDDTTDEQTNLDDLTPTEMSRDQLKAALAARHVEYRKNSTTEDLVELLTERIALAA